MQNNPNNDSMFLEAKNIIKEGGIRSLYSGVTAPVYGSIAIIAVNFGTYNNLKRIFSKYNDGGQITYNQIYIASAIAGFVQTIPMVPVELVRTRM